MRFFDVSKAPPRNGRPKTEHTLDFDGLLEEVWGLHVRRNAEEREWAEAGEDE